MTLIKLGEMWRSSVNSGDLIRDEFGNVGIVLEVGHIQGQFTHVFVHFPSWYGWVIEKLLKRLEQ